MSKKAAQGPSAFDPAKWDLAEGPHTLWEAIEPIFRFHDEVAKFMLEHEAAFKIPILSQAAEDIGKYLDALVYKYLAVFLEPTIQEMRKVVKEAKEDAFNADKSLADYVDIFKENSEESDPSHSVSSTVSVFCSRWNAKTRV